MSLYSDDPQNGNASGGVPQVTALQGVHFLDFNSLGHFASDLQGPYPYTYTFIEPHYGDITANTYAGGSSQHPMDDVYGGENLIANVYEAIRNSVAPGGATAPGDNPDYGYNEYGFTFESTASGSLRSSWSPMIAAGTVDTNVYDHSSVLATIESLYGLDALTARDAAANNLTGLLTEQPAPRTDCPTRLKHPPRLFKAARPRLQPEEQAVIDQQPIPERGNLPGVLSLMLKTEIEMSSRNPAVVAAMVAKVKALKTRGDARAYIASVMDKVKAARAARATASPGGR